MCDLNWLCDRRSALSVPFLRKEVSVTAFNKSLIRVVNFRDRDCLPEPWFYVGRAMPGRVEGSALGNPFKLTRNDTRETVIARYKEWLWAQMNDPTSEARAELHRLAARALEGDLYLACWCAPLSCHADVIKSAIEWINKTKNQEAKIESSE
jgi:hypothetical protein